MIETEPTYTYPHPVGYGIYCKKQTGKLTREHILAFGFGGNLVLPRSSCQECAEITRKIEKTVLRDMFGGYRMRTGMPTRHPNQVPNAITVPAISANGETEHIEVSSRKHHGIMVFPLYPYPGILLGNKENADYKMGAHIIIPDCTDLIKFIAQHSGKHVHVGYADGEVFARVLANTAHAGTFAEIGQHPELIFLLTKIILGKSRDTNYLVGCLLEDIPEPDPDLPHRITLNTVIASDRAFLCADIRLFSYLPTPIYRIVVAERITNKISVIQ